MAEAWRTRVCGGGESATGKRSKRKGRSIVSAADSLIVVGEPSRAEPPGVLPEDFYAKQLLTDGVVSEHKETEGER